MLKTQRKSYIANILSYISGLSVQKLGGKTIKIAFLVPPDELNPFTECFKILYICLRDHNTSDDIDMCISTHYRRVFDVNP